jgi:hypothetical protein
MSNPPLERIQKVGIGGAQIHLLNVQLRDDILLDEVHLEGGGVQITLPKAEGEAARITTGESLFRAVISEPNLNRLLAGNMPGDTSVRNLQIALFSGRARITGQIVRALGLPFTIEAVPRIDNGVRISFDFQSAKIGIGMPAALVDVIETFVNERLAFDLSKLSVPVWLDALRCEPGRLTALGKVRIDWPPAKADREAPALFTARPTFLEAESPAREGVSPPSDPPQGVIEAAKPDPVGEANERTPSALP